ncbi:toprim domain-containing protein [Chitinophaga japonensis]|uniref:Toprim domain-containing protein n=1 Tax=Chitinophaga japonensis TaxID=104662 RepID=A0A562T6V3_CHIJA|nr:toprim domain-containing protein [Chitinophaga japonensis]TWI89279.1 Toprim domain-containing protein [Chitinophaga japonensis]
MKKLTCTQAKQIDLVDYLHSLGHHPVKVRHNDYWYLSPLRSENTASFKVDRRLNLWYDHGSGQGGDLIDFGTLYFNCPVGSLLARLSAGWPAPSLSFHPPKHPAGEKKAAPGSKITVLSSRPLADKSLLDYLQSRCIPPALAARFCKEVDFHLYGKQQKAIGFSNNSGGYELRSSSFKGSSSPKDVTLINNKAGALTVFEGFFNFLSFFTVNQEQQRPLTNCLILNSLAFLEKSRALMEQYPRIHLMLDRDDSGRSYTQKALKWDREKYIDRSDFYQHKKDLNDWLIRQQRSPGEQRRLRQRF